MTEAEKAAMVLTEGRLGLISRDDALEFLNVRQLQGRITSGAWARVFPSVYRLVGAPVTWRQRVLALAMWAGKGAVLSHRTAAVLHGFDSFSEGPLEVTMTGPARAPRGVKVFRVAALAPKDKIELDDLTVTSAARTLIDLSAATDLITLRATIDQALREKKATLEQLEAAVSRAKRRPGVIDVRKLLAEFKGDGGPTDSELEFLSLSLIESAGLPRPKVQWSVVAGRKRRRLDLFFPGVVVEADGYASHAGIDAFEDDRARNNSLTANNLRVLHWTWHALHDHPDELIAQLYVALNLRR